MSDYKYFFKLETPILGQTHVGVLRETRETRSVIVEGHVGMLPVSGPFEPGQGAQKFYDQMSLAQYGDFLDQIAANVVRDPGVPRDEFRSTDVAAWYETISKADARIEARKLAEEETRRLAALAAEEEEEGGT